MRLFETYGRDHAALCSTVIRYRSKGAERDVGKAEQVWEVLDTLTSPQIGLARLSARFGGRDFSGIPLDRVLRRDDFPDPAQVEASKSRATGYVDVALEEGLTLRQLLQKLAGARGHFVATGTPEQVADIIEDWFVTGAADGFNVMPPIVHKQSELFATEVIPILRKRGLFRTDYEGTTLRSHFGLEPVGAASDVCFLACGSLGRQPVCEFPTSHSRASSRRT